jgi:RNA polymerase sigma-70 factor, ECF subfamily
VLRRGKGVQAPRLTPHDADRPAVEAARRDPRAFEALYRKYVAQVYSLALYQLRNVQAAEDVTAQVFMRALAGLPGFREQAEPPASSFRVWLFQIARNTLSNERRRARRHPEAPIELAEMMPATDNVAREVAARDELARAWDAIDRLPEASRRAIVLRFVHQMSTREIGEVLGRTDGSVRVLIHRAVRRLASQLEHDAD